MIKTRKLANKPFSWQEVRLQANDLHELELIHCSIRGHSWTPYSTVTGFVGSVESRGDRMVDAVMGLLLYSIIVKFPNQGSI